MDTWEFLNNIYTPLYHRAKTLCSYLTAAGLSARWHWYSYHFTRREERYQAEYFPIPVITVDQICDIGLELDHIFLEGTLSQKQALANDFTAIPWPFEVYGGQDILQDFYRPGMSIQELPKRIADSGEKTIGLQLMLPADCDNQEILQAAKVLKQLGAKI